MGSFGGLVRFRWPSQGSVRGQRRCDGARRRIHCSQKGQSCASSGGGRLFALKVPHAVFLVKTSRLEYSTERRLGPRGGRWRFISPRHSQAEGPPRRAEGPFEVLGAAAKGDAVDEGNAVVDEEP